MWFARRRATGAKRDLIANRDVTVAKHNRTVAAVVEPLERRQLMSAATVLEALRPLAEWPAHVMPAKHHDAASKGPKVNAKPKKVAGQTGPDILGVWTGTFTTNITLKQAPGAITLTNRVRDNFTGTFDTSGVGGSVMRSTVVVTRNRQFLAMLKTAPKQQVSLAGTVTSDLKFIIGRWSMEGGKKWTTGIFRLERAS